MSAQLSKKINDSFHNVGNALERLHEGLVESGNAKSGSLLIDGTIQRFEICCDQMWKLFLYLLKEEMIETEPSPKKIMKKVYSLAWVDDEKLWIGMLDDRNVTSHVYDKELAKQIYDRIKSYYPEMQNVFDNLLEKHKNSTN